MTGGTVGDLALYPSPRIVASSRFAFILALWPSSLTARRAKLIECPEIHLHQGPDTFAQTELRPSDSSCNRAADHTFSTITERWQAFEIFA